MPGCADSKVGFSNLSVGSASAQPRHKQAREGTLMLYKLLPAAAGWVLLFFEDAVSHNMLLKMCT